MQHSQIKPISSAKDSVCVGKILALTDATPGGTWSSSNTGIATVNTSTGVVTGINAGTATISYAVGSTPCPATFNVTVVAPPTSGKLYPRTVCSNNPPFTLTFSVPPSSTAGTWSASPSSLGTINPSTGFIALTGATGILSVTYAPPTLSNCTPLPATATVTINPSPGFSLTSLPPDGNICTGHTYTLCAVGVTNCSGCSYLWDWGPTTSPCAAHPGINLNFADPCRPSVYTDSLRLSNNFGCSTTKTVTVNIWPSPSTPPISGPAVVCSGDIATYSVPPRTCPGTWSISPSLPASGVYIDPATGILHCGTDIDAITTPTVITVQYTIPNPGCGSIPSMYFVTINPVPYATASLIGTCNPICPGSTFSVLLHGSPNATVTYTWTDPGGTTSVSASVTLDASGNYTLSPTATAIGTASVAINSVTLPGNKCQRRPPKPFAINIAYPSCNLVLADSTRLLCAGDSFRVWVSGSPGIYSIHADPGIDFDLSVPDGSPVLSPWLHISGSTLTINICVLKIVGCSCTVEMGAPHDPQLCCLNVIGNPRPQIDLSYGAACVGYPFWLGAWVETTSTLVSELNWYSPAGGLYATTSPVPYGDNHTAPTTAMGVFSVTAIAANGCTSTQTINVSAALPAAITDMSVSGSLCAGTTTSVTVTVTGTPGTYGSYIIYPYSVSGSFPPIPATGSEVLPFSATVPIAGTLTVVVTSIINPYHCIDSGPYDTLLIPVDPAPAITLATSTNPCGDQRLIFNGTPTGSVISYETGGVAQPDVTLIAGGIGVPESVTVPTVYTITDVVGPHGCHMPAPFPSATLDTMSLWACVEEQRDPYLSGYVFTGTPGAQVTIYYLGLDATLTNPTTNTTVITLSSPAGTFFIPYSSYIGVYDICCMYITSIDYTDASGSTCTNTSPCTRLSRPADNHVSNTVEANTTIKVIPNPNNGSFSILGTLSTDKNTSSARVDVLDAVGRVVYTATAPIKNGEINTDIMLDQSIADGAYIVRISSGPAMKMVKMTIVR